MDLRIQHASVAPEHLRVRLVADRLHLEDLGSEAGTWHAGERINSSEFALGTGFRIGAIEVRFEQDLPIGAVAGESALAPDLLSRHDTDPSFQDLMADQLRRAPWMMISVTMHLLLLFLLQWLVADPPPPRRDALLIQIGESSGHADVFSEDPREDSFEVEETADEIVVENALEDSSFDAPSPVAEKAFSPAEEPVVHWMGEGAFADLGKLRRPAGGDGGGDVLGALRKSGITGEFRSTVEGLRKTGLDIAFVFDSTQSMDDVLDKTKARIAGMIDVLQALVPEARIGIVTYRDHGPREEYVTRSIPISIDHFRVINFMQTVHASGGGDFPEAVFDGVAEATKLNWRKGVKRLIVVIGDAPGHDDDLQRLQSLVKRFADGEHSVIHTIMSHRDRRGIDWECRKYFEWLADTGGGAAIPLEDEEMILVEVMSLAFGRTFRRSLDEVQRIVTQRTERISASTRDVVRRADLATIDSLLDNAVRDDEIVRALAHSQSAAIARHLVDRLTSRSRIGSKHAISYALQQILRVDRPIIDPMTGARLSRDAAKSLLRHIDSQLR